MTKMEGFYKAREELRKDDNIEFELKDISNIQYQLLDQENLISLHNRGLLHIVDKEDYNDTMTGLHDPMMGTIRKDITCARCGNDMWKCKGHFGYIKLARNIINPEHVKIVAKILDLFSDITYEDRDKEYYTLIPTDDMIEQFNNFSYFKKLTSIHKKTTKKKTHRVREYDIYLITSTQKGEKGILLSVETVKETLSMLHPRDLEKLGICGINPVNFVMSFIPVLPVAMRPYNTITGQLKADDLTLLYSQIVRANNDFMNSQDRNKNMHKVIEAYQRLTSVGGKCRKGTSSKSIRTVMNSKEGLIREVSLGKRVNYCARAVASPDPFMDVDEIGLPFIYKKGLTTEMRYIDNPTLSNREQCISMIKSGKIKSIVDDRKGHVHLVKPDNIDKIISMLKVGVILHRYIDDGDTVVLHRYPVLHKHSMFAGRIKFIKGNTIRIHPSVAEGLNEDYDGDENNLTIPQSFIVRASTSEVMNVKNCIISEKKSTPIVGITQDFIIGSVKLSSDTTEFSKDEFYQMLSILEYTVDYKELEQRCMKHNINIYSGKALISSILPRDMKFNIKNKENEIIISDGIFISGVLSKSVLSSGSTSIVQHLYKYYSSDIAAQFIKDMHILSITYITNIGFSLGFSDCILPYERKQRIDREIDKTISEVKDINKSSTDDPILAIKREVQISSRLSSLTDIAGKIIVEASKNKIIDIPLDVSNIYISYVHRIHTSTSIIITSDSEESKYLQYKYVSNEDYDTLDKTLTPLNITVNDDTVILTQNTTVHVVEISDGKYISSSYNHHDKNITVLPFRFTDSNKTKRTHSISLVSPISSLNEITRTDDNVNLYLNRIRDIENIEVDYVNKKLYINMKDGNRIPMISKGAKMITIETGNFKYSQSLLEEENPFRTMVDYGAKGTPLNMIQLSGLVGQQLMSGNRIPLELTNESRVLPHFDIHDNDPVARGFCRSSYVEGLTPTEQFMHFILTREGLTDSSTKTSETGYTYRKLSHFLENIRTEYDGSVRDQNGNIIQFLYGSDGYDASQTVNVKGNLTFANVDVLSSKIPSVINKTLYLYRCKTEDECRKLLYIIPILLYDNKDKIKDYDIIVFVKEELYKEWYVKLKTNIVDVLPGYITNTEIQDLRDEYDTVYVYEN